MATWTITTRGRDWAVVYTSPHLIHDCGLTPKDQTNLQGMVDWLSDEADPGDIIALGDALLFQKLQPAGA
jgi:hypothetical protein